MEVQPWQMATEMAKKVWVVAKEWKGKMLEHSQQELVKMEVEVRLKRYQLELEELKMEKDGRRYEDQKMLDKTDESVAL